MKMKRMTTTDSVEQAKKPVMISIYADSSEAVAREMLSEGQGVGLLAPTLSVSIDDCPYSAVHDTDGSAARMVIVMPWHLYREYRRRVNQKRCRGDVRR